MYLINNYKDIITKKYYCFDGRAGRKEFWMFILANFIVNIILGFIPGNVGAIIKLVYALAVLLPSLGVCARRLHDTGKSGWLQLLGIIPIIGGIIVLILCLGKKAEGCGCGCGCEQK